LNFEFFKVGRACCTDDLSICMGMSIHKVSADMAFEMDSLPATLTETALADAVKAQVASATGIAADAIGNVTVSVKVKGDTSMSVPDAAVFAASVPAKTAVETGIAATAGTTASAVTATLTAGRRLTVEDDDGFSIDSEADEDEGTRRLQQAVTAAYEIETTGVGQSRTMLAGMGAATATTGLATQITTALAASGDATVGSITPTVSSVSAVPKVTVAYEISTTNATAATEAQATMAAAASSGTGQTSLISGITATLAANGVTVTISNMTGTVAAVQASTPGAAAANASSSSRTPTSSAVRHSLRHVAMSVVVTVAAALAL
jgi:hypothetical protein